MLWCHIDIKTCDQSPWWLLQSADPRADLTVWLVIAGKTQVELINRLHSTQVSYFRGLWRVCWLTGLLHGTEQLFTKITWCLPAATSQNVIKKKAQLWITINVSDQIFDKLQVKFITSTSCLDRKLKVTCRWNTNDVIRQKNNGEKVRRLAPLNPKHDGKCSADTQISFVSNKS